MNEVELREYIINNLRFNINRSYRGLEITLGFTASVNDFEPFTGIVLKDDLVYSYTVEEF